MRKSTKPWAGTPVLWLLAFLLAACGSSAEPGAAADGDPDLEREVETGESELANEVRWPIPNDAGIVELLATSAFWAESPWLITDKSSWFEEKNYPRSGETINNSSRLGYYAIGNGVVFAFAGTTYPRHTLHELLGPGYQKGDHGYFSNYKAGLWVNAQALRHSHDWIWRPRQAQIAATRAKYDASPLELHTVSFAPLRPASDPLSRTILQILNVRNTGRETIRDIQVVLEGAGTDTLAANGALTQTRDQHVLRLRLNRENATASQAPDSKTPPRIVSEALELGAGEETQIVAVFEFAKSEAELGAGYAASAQVGATTLLRETAEGWKAWATQGLEVQTPDARVNDLLEGLKGCVRVQIADNGALAPMSNYTNVWIRDSFGATRFLLRFGYPELAAKVSDYYFAAASMRGGIGNALDADLSPTTPLPSPDWSANIPFTGRLRGEGPSHIPLMHLWHWQYTGDATRLTARWPYLLHTLKGQSITPQGLLYFSGDETFRPQLATNIGLSSSYAFEEKAYSAFSGFLFVRAAEWLSAFAKQTASSATADIAWLDANAATVRAATESQYWLNDKKRYSPFIYMDTLQPDTHVAEDVNTQPLWLDYLAATDPKARANIDSSMAEILQANGLLQNALGTDFELMGFPIGKGIMTGMAPAYFLYNAAALNLEVAQKSFDALGQYVSPAGDYPEVGLFADPRRALSPMYDTQGAIGEQWARYRFWEGAISGEALLHYLLGFTANVPAGTIRLAPHLAHQSRWLRAAPLRFKTLELAMALTYDPQTLELRLSLTTKGDPQAAGLKTCIVTLTLPTQALSEARLNGIALEASALSVRSPFAGASEVTLSIPARSGEQVVSLIGRSTGR